MYGTSIHRHMLRTNMCGVISRFLGKLLRVPVGQYEENTGDSILTPWWPFWEQEFVLTVGPRRRLINMAQAKLELQMGNKDGHNNREPVTCPLYAPEAPTETPRAREPVYPSACECQWCVHGVPVHPCARARLPVARPCLMPQSDRHCNSAF